LAVGSITLGLAMIAPGSATLAASSDHVNEHNVDVGCGALSGPGADAYLQPSFNSTFGSDARLQLWLYPDDIIVEQPTVVSGRAASSSAMATPRLLGPSTWSTRPRVTSSASVRWTPN